MPLANNNRVAVMAPKVAPSHPPYVDIIKEAITSLKDRNGSSNQSIRKFVASKYPTLPANWEKVLGLQLRRLTESGKIVKVCFFHLSARSSGVVMMLTSPSNITTSVPIPSCLTRLNLAGLSCLSLFPLPA